MKICFILSGIYAGGAEKVVISLANHLSQNKHKITIVLISSDTEKTFHKVNSNVEIIPLQRIKKCRYINKIKLLRATLVNLQPDIVVSFLHHVCIYSYLALRKTNIPLVCSERNDPHKYNFIIKILLKYIFKRINGCVFQTQDAMSWYFHKSHKNSNIVINNPVVLTTELPSSFNRTNNVVFVGRLSKQKNYKLLIKSFRYFSLAQNNYNLHIFGDGPGKKFIKNYSEKYGISTKIHFYGNDPKWQTITKNSNLFVSTSLYEGMPNSLAEAASLGMNCVATNCPIGGSKTLSMSYPNIHLSNSYSPKFFANIMETASKNNHILPGIHKEYTIENVTERWIDYLSKIIKYE